MFNLPFDTAQIAAYSLLFEEYDLYRWLSTLMYVVFAVGLFYLAAQHHRAIVRGEVPPGQFPPGYFTMLAIQLLPLLISGFVLHDEFIIATRSSTLVIVLVSYALVHSTTGTFDGWWMRRWLTVWLCAACFGVMLWHNPAFHLRELLRSHEQLISWAIVAAMFMFVFFGQSVTAKALYHHFMQGNYTVKRFGLQWVRFIAFGTQALHYWHTPSRADPLRLNIGLYGFRIEYGIDPVFFASALGTIGVTFVLLWSIAGYIGGTRARHAKKYAQRMQEDERALVQA